MQGEKKKANSGSSKRENEQRGPGRIDEYHFFLDQDEEESEDVCRDLKGNKKEEKQEQ